MYRGPSSNHRGGRGGRGRGGHNAQRNQQRGLFSDGIWHCDCDPRLPAEHFRVKKEGPNKGKWFYTCQEQQPKKCGFFLWDEDAKPREEAAVLSGKRREPGGQDGWNAGREMASESNKGPRAKGLFERNVRQTVHSGDESTQSESPPPDYSTQPPGTNGAKRSAYAAELDGDEFDDWSLNAHDEARLANAADTATPITPHKAQKTGVYATPATTAKRKLPWLEQPEPTTPMRQTEDYFTTPSKQPKNTSNTQSTFTEPGTPTIPHTLATASTPSPPTRHRDALLNPADDESSLTSEVLASLSSAHIPAETISNVRSILTKHDLRAQGIKKGRDVSRLALRAKDAKIAELQARIASLEADRELERGLDRMRRSA